MTCDTMRPRLDEYLDGTLPPDVVRDVDAHLATCADCQREVEALRAILAEARALPRSVEPPAGLWRNIEARLPAMALPIATPPRRRLAERPLVLLAAALFLLLAGATLATLYQRSAAPGASAFAAEQARYARATAQLARQLVADSTAIGSETRAVVERNLAIVDQAIQEAERALVTDPGNTELEQMVLARYAQRLALLKHATEAGRRVS